MNIELEREEDGRWIAEAPELPGAMAYGATRQEALSRVETIALQILADRVEHGEPAPDLTEVRHDGGFSDLSRRTCSQ